MAAQIVLLEILRSNGSQRVVDRDEKRRPDQSIDLDLIDRFAIIEKMFCRVDVRPPHDHVYANLASNLNRPQLILLRDADDLEIHRPAIAPDPPPTARSRPCRSAKRSADRAGGRAP